MWLQGRRRQYSTNHYSILLRKHLVTSSSRDILLLEAAKKARALQRGSSMENNKHRSRSMTSAGQRTLVDLWLQERWHISVDSLYRRIFQEQTDRFLLVLTLCMQTVCIFAGLLCRSKLCTLVTMQFDLPCITASSAVSFPPHQSRNLFSVPVSIGS
ncbi:uncharacterized protein EI97DRAFT_38002 [Westerdykella ornata]|uniref:Uncharacterized protein n=1 Tax=Westerdykella ornata TaxID=318751 RepID=A0A6A6JN90_WESOR|nr:uncharacterized protein EI97DRAFT_38002 [Westerdykella ornata]KAF2276389.1 hypothetical protein EI97DRAFT_38002 [Westerdykella ornata]